FRPTTAEIISIRTMQVTPPLGTRFLSHCSMGITRFATTFWAVVGKTLPYRITEGLPVIWEEARGITFRCGFFGTTPLGRIGKLEQQARMYYSDGWRLLSTTKLVGMRLMACRRKNT